MPEFNDNILITALQLPPEEAIKFFRSKGYKIAWDWRETLNEANNKTFQVAKAMKMDVVKDIKDAVDNAIEKGTPFTEFQKQLKPKMVAKGWWGRKVVDGPGGTQEVQLGSPYRLKTIYDTNIRSANNAGRWKGQWENRKRRPYFMLIEHRDGVARKTHKSRSGSIVLITNKFWRSPNSWMPLNGYNCRGRTRPFTEAQAKSRGIGLRGFGNPDPGFGGNPGITMWKPQEKDYPPDVWKLGEELEP